MGEGEKREGEEMERGRKGVETERTGKGNGERKEG